MANIDIVNTLDIATIIDGGANARECLQVVDPQTDTHPVFGGELASQAPTDADVAEIINDSAENIAATRRKR